MNSYKKNEIKKWIAKKKIWLIGSGVAFVGGVTFLMIGMYMTGFSIIKWIQSPYFTTFVVLSVSFILVLLWLIIEMLRARLGGKDDE